MKITRLETFLVRPRSLFLKVHTDEGIVGLGEPVLEGRAVLCARAVQDLAPYLTGKDPRRIAHHWQAMYRHSFYRGGPILTSAISGVEQALWDIAGKSAGLPIYAMLGGAVRDRIRVYAHAGGATPEEAARSARLKVEEGFTAIKTGVSGGRPPRVVETPAFIDRAVATFSAMREAVGNEIDLAIDFHGAVSPQTAAVLIRELEPLKPMFVEEPVQCQNVPALADIARKTCVPIATGERLFTKWAFREVLEQRAASILQPDLSHAGGILECRLIAGMAEASYAAVAPHCPLGPIALAASLQLDACIPNFLIQEQVTLGEGCLEEPFRLENGCVALPDGPGLGIELDEEALSDKRAEEEWRSPELYSPDDGAVLDW